MKKTFCDRCETQCVNTTIMVNLTTVHHTQDNTYVGEDNYSPVEICINCGEELRAAFPQLFKLRPKGDMEEPAMDSPVRAEYRAQAMERN